MIAVIVLESLGVEQVHDRIDTLTRHHLRHHHDIGREGLDHGGDVLQVAAAGRLEPEAGECGPLAGGGEILDVETGDPQKARRSRRPILGLRRLHLLAECKHSPRHHQRHQEREHEQQEQPQVGCGRRACRRQRQSLDMHRPLTNAVHRR